MSTTITTEFKTDIIRRLDVSNGERTAVVFMTPAGGFGCFLKQTSGDAKHFYFEGEDAAIRKARELIEPTGAFMVQDEAEDFAEELERDQNCPYCGGDGYLVVSARFFGDPDCFEACPLCKGGC